MDSVVLQQFGRQIEEVIRKNIKDMEISDIIIKAEDKGALDYIIRARVQTAVERAV